MKKKILLLADDLRMTSGIATMAKEFVLGTVHKYDWVQLGASIQHPELGKVIDLNDDIRQRTGVADAKVKIIPHNGYGDIGTIRKLLAEENQTQSYILLTHTIGNGCMIMNTKSDNKFHYYIIIFGMIYLTHNIIEIIMRVVIG